MVKKTKTDLWHARLKNNVSQLTVDYLDCLKEDKRLAKIDSEVIRTHCRMLWKQGYINKIQLNKILLALKKFENDFDKSPDKLIQYFKKNNFTDIHPGIEKYIIEICGIDTGGMTHLGKSRNDQIVTDMRIYLRTELNNILNLLNQVINEMKNTSKKNKTIYMIGYTHLQPAQKILFSDYIDSYIDSFERSIQVLKYLYKDINQNPLGACALAGTTVNIDKNYTSKLLHFDKNIENTIDAISNRDFLLRTAGELSIIMLNLSRISEDFIIWSTKEFNYIELADYLCDTSTAMPQKKNSSILELLRGKTSTVIGHLTALYIILKGLPTGYNQDLQQMKVSVWVIIDELKKSLNIIKEVFKTLRLNENNIKKSLIKSDVVAIDLAEYIAKTKKISFRQAHFLVGTLVKKLIDENTNLIETFNQNPKKFVEIIKKISKDYFNKELILQPQELNTILNFYF